MKKRIDILIKEKELVRSREIAKNLIESGLVKIKGEIIRKPSKKVDIQSEIEIESLPKYVSRGGEKLEKALEKFGVNVENLIAVDVGASTGGFTDCLLQKGVACIYAVDVGNAQLDKILRKDPRVLVYENTDIRNLDNLPQIADLVVVDVSFISLTLVLSSVKKLLKPEGKIIALIKPQFEVGKENIGKSGVVKSEKAREKAIRKVKEWSKSNGFRVLDIINSPIKGSKGNVEYFIFLELSE